MEIEGSIVNCLLDSGSQVTIIPQSFFQQHLSVYQIKPLFDLLEVEGANGQSAPYLGYIELSITFPQVFLGVDIEVPTLALVVPDIHTASHSLVLDGTNTIDVLYETYCDTPEAQQPTAPGYKAVLKILELRQQQNKDGNLGLVKMHGKSPQMVPAGHTVVLEGCVTVNGFTNEKSTVLEHPSLSSLPGGLLVKPVSLICLLNSHTKCQLYLPTSPNTMLSFPRGVLLVSSVPFRELSHKTIV